jgi:ketosteroid isomerase-like protein
VTEEAGMTIRDELDAINGGMAAALAAQDAKRFASYYADDARLLSDGSPIIRGRADIEAEVCDWVTNTPLTLRFESGDVIADGSLVVDVGRIISPTRQSKYVVVYQRQPDGSLKIAVDAGSSDGPSTASG